MNSYSITHHNYIVIGSITTLAADILNTREATAARVIIGLSFAHIKETRSRRGRDGTAFRLNLVGCTL